MQKSSSQDGHPSRQKDERHTVHPDKSMARGAVQKKRRKRSSSVRSEEESLLRAVYTCVTHSEEALKALLRFLAEGLTLREREEENDQHTKMQDSAPQVGVQEAHHKPATAVDAPEER